MGHKIELRVDYCSWIVSKLAVSLITEWLITEWLVTGVNSLTCSWYANEKNN